MRKEELYEMIGEISENHIKEARMPKPRAKKHIWAKYICGAACACLVAGVILAYRIYGTDSGGLLSGDAGQSSGAGGMLPDNTGIVSGGALPENIDPIIASIAVYPATEEIQNVENAVLENMDEASAHQMAGLGEYLPEQLPEGCFFRNAHLYETTMKNGTKYDMLRVYYTTGTALPGGIDGETGELVTVLDEAFFISIMNYRPKTDKTIHSMEDLPNVFTNKTDGSIFFFAYENVYISFSPNELSADEMLCVIDSMK